MSKTAEKAAEREGLITRNWVLGGGAGSLLLAQGLLTYIISNAAEIKATNEKLTKLTSTVEIEAVRQRVADLETAKAEAAKTHRDIELRLNSLEQRTAVHDTWMSSHK
ncbi:hypothetical protein [Hymenobacter sp. CRA2]|uniref:hypothetical protein n=1 Tax=Hymenobacter sp. CRA2 TaxID=1955620 RepID=UPI00098F750C|nr:hypothetical protein [Hymenobacter sp. CRA2]OON67640.1 hypothetical protein B0919_17605 [Hymenobacter sp. CRA2]